MKITAKIFKEATGLDPQDDDLDRCNCNHSGQLGHYSCGWSVIHNKPIFMLSPEEMQEMRRPIYDVYQ